jgi:hypothetical protein
MANIKRANTSGITKSGVAIPDVPDAPVIGAATNVGTARAYNNGSATVAFTAAATGGTPASYTATSTPGSFTATGAGSPLTVTGLQSATSYTFAVTGTNASATGAASAASSSITATTVPAAPTIGTATLASGQSYTGSASISVPFTAPATGGAAISSYTVTSSSGNTGTGSSSPVSVSETVGNPTSTARTYTVTATNTNGASLASSASNSIAAVSVPQAPTIGAVTASDSSVTVAYTAGATGGAAVTTYTATSSPGGFTGTGASPITVSGLTNGTSYTFTVTATNSAGTSAASSASSSVAPVLPAQYDSLATVSINGVNTATISSIPNTYTHLVLRWTTNSGGQQNLFYRFNGTGAYRGLSQRILSNNSRDTAADNGSGSLSGGSTSGNFVTGNVLYIPNYKDTTQKRTNLSYFGGRDTAQINGFGFQSGMADFTTAVSSITIFLSSGNMGSTGASLSLYGIK